MRFLRWGLISLLCSSCTLQPQMIVEQQPKDPVILEMEALGNQLRQKAQELMDVGDVETAQMILKQIALYFPS